jgi:hypothetical protein
MLLFQVTVEVLALMHPPQLFPVIQVVAQETTPPPFLPHPPSKTTLASTTPPHIHVGVPVTAPQFLLSVTIPTTLRIVQSMTTLKPTLIQTTTALSITPPPLTGVLKLASMPNLPTPVTHTHLNRPRLITTPTPTSPTLPIWRSGAQSIAPPTQSILVTHVWTTAVVVLLQRPPPSIPMFGLSILPLPILGVAPLFPRPLQ